MLASDKCSHDSELHLGDLRACTFGDQCVQLSCAQCSIRSLSLKTVIDTQHRICGTCAKQLLAAPPPGEFSLTGERFPDWRSLYSMEEAQRAVIGYNNPQNECYLAGLPNRNTQCCINAPIQCFASSPVLRKQLEEHFQTCSSKETCVIADFAKLVTRAHYQKRFPPSYDDFKKLPFNALDPDRYKAAVSSDSEEINRLLQ